jgi:hypothetical protein
MAIFAESPLSPDRPTQSLWRVRGRPDRCAKVSGGGGDRRTFRQPSAEIGIVCTDDVAI